MTPERRAELRREAERFIGVLELDTDEALALLNAADELERVRAANQRLGDQLLTVRAELGRAQGVVQAAETWRSHDEECEHFDDQCECLDSLADAVDGLRAALSPPQEKEESDD